MTCNIISILLITLIVLFLYKEFFDNSLFLTQKGESCPEGNCAENFCQCNGECGCADKGLKYPLYSMYKQSCGFNVPTTTNLYEPYYML